MALLVKELSRFCNALPVGSIVVASSDVLLDLATSASFSTPSFPVDAISVVGVPEQPELAKNHGVLVQDPLKPDGLAKDYLQKPSVDVMSERGAVSNGKVYIDTGIVVATGNAFASICSLLDDPVVSLCTERGISLSAPSQPLRLELYSGTYLP